MNKPVLEVRGLTVSYPTPAGRLQVVRNVDLVFNAGEAFGLIGESGSGKSTVAFSIMRYLSRGGRVESGTIFYRERNLLSLPPIQLRKIFGKSISFVAQEPMNALNPSLKIGTQITEILRTHLKMSKSQSYARALHLLDMVHLSGRERVLDSYAHQLSGGMQQRVCIAFALACEPDLMVLDEPTTALDATTEAAFLDLIEELKSRIQTSMFFITHNISVVARIADRVAVMYGGQIVEEGSTDSIFARPSHRYTQMLLSAVPRLIGQSSSLIKIPWVRSIPTDEGCAFRNRCDIAIDACSRPTVLAGVEESHVSRCRRWQYLRNVSNRSTPSERSTGVAPVTSHKPEESYDRIGSYGLFRVQELRHEFIKKGLTLWGGGHAVKVQAIDGVSFSVDSGQTLAVVGETGCGKSTLAKCSIGLLKPTSGSIKYDGVDLLRLFPHYPRKVRKEIQIVFQNAQGSLHPLKTVKSILERMYKLYYARQPNMEELIALLNTVNLEKDVLSKKPAELSGGEKQRVALARAFVSRPKLVILDEVLSALDVSLKSTVIDLLRSLQRDFGTAYLFISHDLAVVRYMADHILVMYLGSVCESGSRDQVLSPPYHPYTEALLSAAGEPQRECGKDRPRIRLKGHPPSLSTTFPGCRFNIRCPRQVGQVCEQKTPQPQQTKDGHIIVCHIPIDKLKEMQHQLAGNIEEGNV